MPTSDAEYYAYAAVWLLLGLALLAYGVWRKSRKARLASAFFVIVTTLKVFVFDLAGLQGALRALSFLGLGVALIGIGLVYQRVVFARPKPLTLQSQPLRRPVLLPMGFTADWIGVGKTLFGRPSNGCSIAH